jgi:hypothetical protein
MSTTPPPSPSEVSYKVACFQRVEKKTGRGTGWVFIEMLCAFLTVTGVNMKVADGPDKRETLSYQNDTFKCQV